MIATVTHARLRAEQGDLPGARRILREVLRYSPADADALHLLEQCLGRPARPRSEPDEEVPIPPQSSTVDALRDEFRVALDPSLALRRRKADRLRAWLDRIQAARE